MTAISLHIHSFSYRFHLKYGPDGYDVFSYIDQMADAGFTGLNISANGPGYRDLCGTDDAHFAAVRRAVEKRGLKLEIDTSDTRPENMLRMLDVAAAVGADQLRTYTKYQGSKRELLDWTIRDLKAVAPRAGELGIRIVLENHEDFQGGEIAEILAAVNDPWVRALYDYGNSQMVGEEPAEALARMLPWTTCVHIKDHVLLRHDGRLWVQGVTMGQGRLPIMDLTRRILDGGLRRLCFENVWAYTAPVKVPEAVLPATPCFAVDEAGSLLEGRDLPQAEALAGEHRAWQEGWAWFRSALAQAGIAVRPERELAGD